MSEEKLSTRTMERHAQTIIVVVIVGLLGWVATTAQQTQVAVAKISVEIEHLKIEAAKPSGKFADIEKRLDAIERQLSTIAGAQQSGD